VLFPRGDSRCSWIQGGRSNRNWHGRPWFKVKAELTIARKHTPRDFVPQQIAKHRSEFPPAPVLCLLAEAPHLTISIPPFGAGDQRPLSDRQIANAPRDRMTRPRRGECQYDDGGVSENSLSASSAAACGALSQIIAACCEAASGNARRGSERNHFNSVSVFRATTTLRFLHHRKIKLKFFSPALCFQLLLRERSSQINPRSFASTSTPSTSTFHQFLSRCSRIGTNALQFLAVSPLHVSNIPPLRE